MSFIIRPFERKNARYFRELNEAWLEKYFFVEEKDKEILENSESYIIEKGGHIFFAEVDGQIAGCFSFIRIDEGIYELGKMAVDEQFQGKKIGQRMMEHGISFAQEQGWKKIILYSHSKLGPALYIYRKYGFREIQLEENTPYLRSDIKMELVL